MTAIRIALLAGLSLQVWGQDGTVQCRPGPNKGAFSYKTQLEPPVPPLATNVSGSLLCTGFGAHRAIADPAMRKYFGYDIDIEPGFQANTYRLTLKPLSATPKEMGLGDAIGWPALALPRLPEPQIVSVGDTIAIDLFVNPVTGQKIVDYIRIEDLPRGAIGKQAASMERARDFMASDAELRLIETRVILNGRPVAKFGDVTAAVVSFYLPQHGRYTMALVAHPELGFQKAGEIRGSSLSFAVAGDTISFECRERIASQHAPYNLYVRYDHGWAPKSESNSASLVAAEDRVENILR